MLIKHFIAGYDSAKIIYLNSGNGTISSPDIDGDGLYDFNVDYLWIVEVPKDQIIRYQVHEILIRISPACEQDGLEVCNYEI